MKRGQKRTGVHAVVAAAGTTILATRGSLASRAGSTNPIAQRCWKSSCAFHNRQQNCCSSHDQGVLVPAVCILSHSQAPSAAVAANAFGKQDLVHATRGG